VLLLKSSSNLLKPKHPRHVSQALFVHPAGPFVVLEGCGGGGRPSAPDPDPNDDAETCQKGVGESWASPHEERRAERAHNQNPRRDVKGWVSAEDVASVAKSEHSKKAPCKSLSSESSNGAREDK